MPENIPPKISTLSAIIIGYLLLEDMTPNEQNALGNWLMLIAQILCTNAAFNQTETSTTNLDENETIILMQKMIKAMSIEIENIKREL